MCRGFCFFCPAKEEDRKRTFQTTTAIKGKKKNEIKDFQSFISSLFYPCLSLQIVRGVFSIMYFGGQSTKAPAHGKALPSANFGCTRCKCKQASTHSLARTFVSFFVHKLPFRATFFSRTSLVAQAFRMFFGCCGTPSVIHAMRV